MKKTIALFAAIALGAALIGCGSGESSSTETTGGTTASAGTTAGAGSTAGAGTTAASAETPAATAGATAGSEK